MLERDVEKRKRGGREKAGNGTFAQIGAWEHGRGGMWSLDLNILISSSHAVRFRRYETITRWDRERFITFCRNFALTSVADETSSSCRAMMPNTSCPRKHSFRINSITDYWYRFSSQAFPSLITWDWYDSLAIGSIRCIPITMLTDAKIEYYSFIGPSAGKEHDRDSIFLHIIVFRSLNNGLFRVNVMECTQKM